jgi:predicted secreted hydrolase
MRGYGLLCGSIATVFLFSLLCIAEAAPPIYPAVVAGRTLQFPRDFGAHPDYRLEWWYATGWLETNDGKPLGFQITFFRSTLNIDAANPSIFAPKQLVFAHAALSDPAQGHLLHDQRIARTAFDLAGAKEIDTDAWIDDWRFVHSGEQYKVQPRIRLAAFPDAEATDTATGYTRLQPQGAGTAASELLLQSAASRSKRQHHSCRQKRRACTRHRMAGPRVVYRLSG